MWCAFFGGCNVVVCGVVCLLSVFPVCSSARLSLSVCSSARLSLSLSLSLSLCGRQVGWSIHWFIGFLYHNRSIGTLDVILPRILNRYIVVTHAQLFCPSRHQPRKPEAPVRSSLSSLKLTAPVRDRVAPDRPTPPTRRNSASTLSSANDETFPALIQKTSSAPVLAVELGGAQVLDLLNCIQLWGFLL